MPPPDVTEAQVLDVAAPAPRQPPPADRLPTLTEVVLFAGELVHAEPKRAETALPESAAMEVAEAAADSPVAAVEAPRVDLQAGLDHGLSAASLLASALPGGQQLDTQALTQLVLAELAPRIDALFESRLREALAPALARAADTLIRQSRDELTLALRDLVQDAVTRTLRQQRSD
jgi:hypothetical protein